MLALMRKKWVHALLIGTGTAALALGLWQQGALSRWELVTVSWRARRLARPGRATDSIKVILLDQASLDWGRRVNQLSWPWPRELYSAILDFCRRAGARAVVFDVLMTEPSYLGPDDDKRLAESIERSRGFVGAIALSDHEGEWVQWPPDASDHGARLEPPRRSTAPPTFAAPARYATFPIPEIYRNAALLGNVNDLPDDDGIYRRATLFREFDGRLVPLLGVAACLADRRAARGAVDAVRIEKHRLYIGPFSAPVDADGRAWLRFRGPSGTHQTFSAAAVIQSELRLREGSDEPPPVPPEVFRDAYVFFGFSAPGLLDLRPTPLSRVYPGVEIHATALDNLLSGDFLRPLPMVSVLLGVLVLSLGAALLTVFARRTGDAVIAFVVGGTLPFGLGFLLYAAGWMVPIMPVWVGVTMALASGLLYNYATEGRQKAFLKQAFRHYLSPAVIERLLEDPSQLRLGGERRELTIFFSDLQGFSSISEKLDPETLTSLLNDYLTDMTDIILEEGGTLDKYEGDAIIAFWNAPLPQPDHARRAIRAAIHCQRKLDERRAEFRQRCGVDLRMRIGIHTGEVVVGNMGSRERFDYTVLGDAANLASRLEGANKAFGTFVMVSETTWIAAGGAFPGRELAILRVVGRRTPIRVFEPALSESPPEIWREFEAARRAFCAGQFEEAARRFERLADDPASQAYLARCRAFLQEPPADWDGVWELTSK